MGNLSITAMSTGRESEFNYPTNSNFSAIMNNPKNSNFIQSLMETLEEKFTGPSSVSQLEELTPRMHRTNMKSLQLKYKDFRPYLLRVKKVQPI